MDVNTFLLSLLHELSSLEFVEKVDLHTEVFILKGRAILKKNRFLQIYFNEHTDTFCSGAFGIDYRSWHP